MYMEARISHLNVISCTAFPIIVLTINIYDYLMCKIIERNFCLLTHIIVCVCVRHIKIHVLFSITEIFLLELFAKECCYINRSDCDSVIQSIWAKSVKLNIKL